jgi:hypothetical protein
MLPLHAFPLSCTSTALPTAQQQAIEALWSSLSPAETQTRGERLWAAGYGAPDPAPQSAVLWPLDDEVCNPHASEAATPCTRGCNPMHQRLQPSASQVCGENDATAPRPDDTNASLKLSSPVLLLHRRGDFVRSVCVNALNPRQLAVSLGRGVQQVELAAAAPGTLMPGSPGSDKVSARPATQWTTWGDGLRNAAALRNPLLSAAGDAQLSAQLSSGSDLTAHCLCSHPNLPLYLAGGDGIVQCWQFGHSSQGRGLQDHLRAQYRLPSGRPLRWLSMAARRHNGSGAPIPSTQPL